MIHIISARVETNLMKLDIMTTASWAVVRQQLIYVHWGDYGGLQLHRALARAEGRQHKGGDNFLIAGGEWQLGALELETVCSFDYIDVRALAFRPGVDKGFESIPMIASRLGIGFSDTNRGERNRAIFEIMKHYYGS